MHRARVVVWAMVAAGCGPTITLDDTGVASESSEGAATTAATAPATSTTFPPGTASSAPQPTSSTTPVPPADDTTIPASTDDGTFLELDDGPPGPECDLWAQDCPRGEKCMPWANDGGNSWNTTRCSPIAPDAGAPGDPCQVEGSPVSGIDDCELGSICWDVNPETNEGYCLAFCTGSPESPYCEDPDTFCQIGGDGLIALCLPVCNPLTPDCPSGQACYPLGETFACVPDASDGMGAAGEPCEFINVCEAGTFCVIAESVPDCMGAVGCCTPFCALDDPMPPCLPGQQCEPYFEPGTAPGGYELLGACMVP